MTAGKRRVHLGKGDVIVQVQMGGVKRTVKGILNRSLRRPDRSLWRKVCVEEGRSLLAFVSGLLLASVYGITALFLQKQPLWFCVYSTLTVAGLAAFGMGLSTGIRADVTVMLPSLCSAHGRKLLLFLFASLLLSGPLSNTLENTERAAASLLCGAELAANQTQELMQRAATPLFSALESIREISSNARAVAGRVQNLIQALTDSVRHVARTLRNVLHFLVDIGDVCNATLGSPYRKCRSLFAEAKEECSGLLGEFSFLCDILDAFLPLCNLARAGELFCVLPSYIGGLLKKRLAAPTIAAFERMKKEFEFNLTASVTYDLEANASRSLQQTAQSIMEEVSAELHLFQWLNAPMAYAGLILLGLAFIRAARYRRRYLRDLGFDNVFISAQFEEFDQSVTSGGGTSVLPLTGREAKTYITPLAFQLSFREQRAVLRGLVSVLKHAVMGGLLVGLDYLVFWMLDQVNHQVKGDVLARAPVTVAVQVNGSGYASDIFRDLVSSFNVLQGGNITVISRKCLVEPSQPDYSHCFTLGFLLGLALLVSLTGGFAQRCRRIICASYHPEREMERMRFLREQILDQRWVERRGLRSVAVFRSVGLSGFQSLLSRLPLELSHLLSSPSCLSCGEKLRSDRNKMVACEDPQCPGRFCRPCFQSLGNVCVVCARPMTSEEGPQEEGESSDDDGWSSSSSSSANSDVCSAATTRPIATRRLATGGYKRRTTQRERESSDSGADVMDSHSSSESSLQTVTVHNTQDTHTRLHSFK